MNPRRAILLFLLLLCLAFVTDGALAQTSGPRPGKYVILTYGAPSSPPLNLGYFILGEGGSYKAFLPGDKLSGEGRYEYDAPKSTVVWKTGPYANVWGGEFTIEREGKTHKIRMKRNTVATNSTDSQR